MTEEMRQIFAQKVHDVAMIGTPEQIAAEEEKRQRLAAERVWMERQAAANRQRLAEEKREKAESDFRSQVEAKFFEANPNAENKDFLRLYSRIRDEVMIDRLKSGLAARKGLPDVEDFR
jgi:hypothetical protein